MSLPRHHSLEDIVTPSLEIVVVCCRWSSTPIGLHFSVSPRLRLSLRFGGSIWNTLMHPITKAMPFTRSQTNDGGSCSIWDWPCLPLAGSGGSWPLSVDQSSNSSLPPYFPTWRIVFCVTCLWNKLIWFCSWMHFKVWYVLAPGCHSYRRLLTILTLPFLRFRCGYLHFYSCQMFVDVQSGLSIGYVSLYRRHQCWCKNLVPVSGSSSEHLHANKSIHQCGA